MDEYLVLLTDGCYRFVPLIQEDEDDEYDNPEALERWGDRKYRPLTHDFLHA